MRILHVVPAIDPSGGGPVRSLMAFIGATREMVDVEVLTTISGSPRKWRRYVERQVRVPIHWMPHMGRHSKNVSIPAVLWLYENISRFDLLHLHACFSPINTVAAGVSRRMRIPYIIRPLGTLSPYSINSYHRTVKKIYWRFFEKRTVEGSASIHATSDMESREIGAVGMDTRIRKIPIPVDVVGNSNRQGTSISNFVYLGRIHPKKGIEFFLRALSKLDINYLQSLKCRIYGNGDRRYVRSVENLVHRLCLTDYVSFEGEVRWEAREKVWKMADVFFLTSHHENFGVAAAEAMARGVPIMISDKVALAVEVLTYDAGWVVPLDADEIASMIQDIIEKPKAWRRKGDNARMLVQNQFDRGVIGEELISMYQNAQSAHAG
ncbi:MAG: glycosyltransferase [Candidatus Neomarinimicrobiota bacterium]